jgi:adenine/guanine phosphoribosyltransferase-like PRPP-binding protein
MLSPLERENELDGFVARPSASVSTDRDARLRALQASWALTPTLPGLGPRCSICRAPIRASGWQCGRCQKLLDAHVPTVDSLEFVTSMGTQAPAYARMAAWKKAVHGESRYPADDADLDYVAVALSAYLEAHASRLCAGSPLITVVPTAAPVLAVALARAAELGWFSVEPVELGTKHGLWFQHEKHLPREADDWLVSPEVVAGRAVLLFDDFCTTGHSVFSFATALRAAGAREVRAVVFQRVVHDEYYVALAWLRRHEGLHEVLTWSPDRAEVTRPREVFARLHPPR